MSRFHLESPPIATLAHRIAYQSSRTDIELNCPRHGFPGEEWYDTAGVHDGLQCVIDEAVEYLELRDLLLRHPEDYRLVRPLESPAPGDRRWHDLLGGSC